MAARRCDLERPLGAALSVVMMAATLLVIGGYRRLSGEKSLEGIV